MLLIGFDDTADIYATDIENVGAKMKNSPSMFK